MEQKLSDHIRTVHFSLLLLCLIVISAAPRHVKSEVNEAFEDAQNIQRLDNGLTALEVSKEIERFLDGVPLERSDNRSDRSQLGHEVQPGPSPQAHKLWERLPEQFGRNYLQRVQAAWPDIVSIASLGHAPPANFPRPWLFCGWGYPDCRDKLIVPKDWTISDFKSFWADWSFTVPRIEENPVSTVTFKRDAIPDDWLKHWPAESVCEFEAESFGSELLTETHITCKAEGQTAEWVAEFKPGIPVHRVLVNEVMNPSSNNIQRPWEKIAKAAGDPFQRTFPALAAMTKELPDLTLTDLVSTLKLQAEAEPERIQVFGASFPFSRILLAFSGLIGASQFYLWAHVKELKRLLIATPVAEWPTGFIGLYPDAITKWIFAITVTGLPVATTGYLLLRSLSPLSWKTLAWPEFVGLASVILSVCLGARSAYMLSSVGGIRAERESRPRGSELSSTECAPQTETTKAKTAKAETAKAETANSKS